MTFSVTIIQKLTMLALTLFLVVSSSGASELEELTADSAEEFFDATWKNTISPDGKIPGAVVTVVKDGKILFAKGYGVRDIDTDEPVDAERTRVRIGSVSKLFSALTALTLVEDGQLDLDIDVNRYLQGIRVPATFSTPVTIRSLLSHTSGFDASFSGYTTFSNSELEVPVEEYNRHLIRMRPIGQIHRYDNMAVGLLGYICGRANGTTFAEAVKQRIIEPLGLHRTTMGIPDDVMPEVAACHTLNSAGEVVKCRPKLMRIGFQAPGDITTTAPDMGRFMIALLNGGELEGKRVLNQELFSEFMDPDQNRWHPVLPGMGFIIYESRVNGRRSMGHIGGQDGFYTVMNLFPESNVGIFASVFIHPYGIPEVENLGFYLDLIRRRAGMAQRDVDLKMNKAWSDFAQKFLPPSGLTTKLPYPAKRSEPLSVLNGLFSVDNNSYPVMDRMFRAFNHIRVDVRDDKVFIDGKGPYYEIAPYELALHGDEVHYAFRVNQGAVELNNSNGMVPMPLVKQPWHYRGELTVLPLLLIIFLGIPAGAYAAFGKRNRDVQRLCCIAFTNAALLSVGLLLEFQYFPSEYYPKGASLFLIFWRLLIHLAWAGSAFGLIHSLRRYRKVYGFAGAKATMRSLFVFVLAAGFLATVVLVPYWGLLFNFTR
jgi:CubicO group peptidase (beta-lactamase class C family)